MKKDPVIDVIKGLAIILVVFGHVIQRSMMASGHDFYLNPFFKVIYMFHMPLFVFISGYLMANSVAGKGFADVFRSRCKSLLVPFLAWGALGLVAVYAFGLADEQGAGAAYFVWFLSTLFLASCLLLGSILLEKKIGIMAFAAVYFLVLAIPWNQYGGIYYLQWFYLFYLAGYFTNRCGVRIDGQWPHALAAGAALTAFFVLERFWVKGDYIYINRMCLADGQLIAEILRIMYRYAAGFLGIFVTWYIGMRLCAVKVGRVLGYIGIYCLDIYLIQRYLLEGLYLKWAYSVHLKVDAASPLFVCFFVPLAGMAFIFTCIFISNVLIRKNILLNRILLGARG